MIKESLGVWIIGSCGSVASAVVAGAEMLAQRRTEPLGLLTEIPDFKNIDFVPFDRMVFGGHEVRQGSVQETFDQLVKSAHVDHRLVENVGSYFKLLRNNTRSGITLGCGKGLTEAISGVSQLDALPLEKIIQQLVKDITDFKASNHLARVIVLNLASTEPPIIPGPHTETMDGFEEMIKENRKELVRASSLYAYVAFKCGCPYINFTPSIGAATPALLKLAEQRAIPHAGRDGKTGETLIKAALASMFKYRALKVLSWQGYNILGNMDGKVLADPENLQSKIAAKDTVLPQTLGYKPHTHVGIDYVPSLGEWKVAWDFIHFEGFMGTKMSMQFTWQGCDSMLAAPLVLDLVRLVDLAARRKESGALGYLGLFFKQPQGTEVSDLHHQWHLLGAHLDQIRKEKSA